MSTTWTIVAEPVRGPVARAVVREYLADIIGRFHGRTATEAEIDAVLAEEPDDGLGPPDGTFLVLYRGPEPCGCGIRALEPGIAELKRMHVRPDARGRGMGSRLLAAAESCAKAFGYRAVRLDTRHDLVEARRLYAARGFAEIPAYNDGPYAEHWFEKVLRCAHGGSAGHCAALANLNRAPSAVSVEATPRAREGIRR